MTKVATCNVKDATKMVYVMKQWHLGPKIVTKGFKEKYPQEKNLTAVYRVLEEGVKHGEFQLVVSEGCEGVINSDFKPVFNGWDYNSLKKQSQQRGYEKIITLVPLKIQAKYGDKTATICGDNDALIQEGNLHISNLRGWSGFHSRLTESKDDAEKTKLYADEAADLLKVPRNTPRDMLMSQIRDQIKSELDAFQQTITKRNDAYVESLQNKEFSKAAIVIGGLHATDLKAKLEKAGLGCEILEPPGYQSEDEKLIQEFERQTH
jgi:hypothetical protein